MALTPNFGFGVDFLSIAIPIEGITLTLLPRVFT